PSEALDGLQRQPVDEVDAHRAVARLAGRLDELPHLLDALDAVDRELDPRVEVLHAEAQAVEAEPAEEADAVGTDGARVDLDGELVPVAVVERERAAEQVEQVLELRVGEVGRRAAAQVELLDAARPIEQAALERDL